MIFWKSLGRGVISKTKLSIADPEMGGKVSLVAEEDLEVDQQTNHQHVIKITILSFYSSFSIYVQF